MTGDTYGKEAAKRRGKGSSDDRSPDLGSKGGTETAIGTDGNFNLGTSRTAWQGPNISIPLAGGIISQLIEEVEDQLGGVDYQVNNAQECIEWYQREKTEYERRSEKLKARLESLKDLESQLDGLEANQ